MCSLVNTLELIGSPIPSRPRVKQPSAEGVAGGGVGGGGGGGGGGGRGEIEPLVPMPGTPAQHVKVDTSVSQVYTNDVSDER